MGSKSLPYRRFCKQLARTSLRARAWKLGGQEKWEVQEGARRNGEQSEVENIQSH